MSSPRSDHSFRWIFITVVLTMVLDRAWMVYTTMGYASDDVTVIWLAAKDYSHGIFHEPFFYGQDYGVMLEALVAAPFVALGADPVHSIAVVIGLFAIVPYVAFAFHFRARGNWWGALLFASMPLLLPVEHGLQITALNGLAVLALAPLVMRVTSEGLRHLLLSFVLVLAVFVNPNALLFALPIGMDHLIAHGRSWRTWLSMALGLGPVLLAWALTREFFDSRHAQVVHTIFDWRMDFKPYMIPDALVYLDDHFAWMGPLCGDHASIALALLLAATVVLFVQRAYSMAWATVATVSLIVFAFSFAKAHDGTGSIFFPLSRIFLGLPLVLALVWGRIRIRPHTLHTATLVLCFIAVTHGVFRTTNAGTTYANALEDQERNPTRTWSVARIKEQCARVAHLAEKDGSDRIILLRGDDPFGIQFLAYTIPVFHPEAPMTWMVGHDRRRFQRSRMTDAPVKRILFVGGNNDDLQHILALGGSPSLLRASGPRAIAITLPERPVKAVLEALE